MLCCIKLFPTPVGVYPYQGLSRTSSVAKRKKTMSQGEFIAMYVMTSDVEVNGFREGVGWIVVAIILC